MKRLLLLLLGAPVESETKSLLLDDGFLDWLFSPLVLALGCLYVCTCTVYW